MLFRSEASFRRRSLTSTRSMLGWKEQPRCRRAESRTCSIGWTGRRPQAVVHGKIAAEPDSCCSVPEPTESGNSQNSKPLSRTRNRKAPRMNSTKQLLLGLVTVAAMPAFRRHEDHDCFLWSKPSRGALQGRSPVQIGVRIGRCRRCGRTRRY